MQAVVWTDFGKIAVQDVPAPVPGREEVLVRVKAATLCKTDVNMIEHGILGIDPPVIIGHEVAGLVVAAGPAVQGLAVGQLVALDPPVPCRRCPVCLAGLPHMCPHTRHIGAHTPGGMAEYIAIDYRNAYAVPAGVSPLAASLAEPFASSLEALERAGGVAGRTIVIAGDGPFGIIMCRLAARAGARQVLLFGHHAERMALATPYGVLAFDGRAVDTGRCIAEHTAGLGADALIDTTASPQVMSGAIGWLAPRGTLVVYALPEQPIALDLATVHFKEIQVHGACRSLAMFPAALQALAADGTAAEALISRTLPIADVAYGFSLITDHKADVVKVAVVFD